jgi:hypothetical protein
MGVFNVIKRWECIHQFESKVKLWVESVNEETQLIRSNCTLELLLNRNNINRLKPNDL